MDLVFLQELPGAFVAPWPEAPQMPLEPPDKKHWKAASGYVQLGMYLEADAELDEIDPFCRAAPEVLAVRLEIYAVVKKWELMQAVAKKLAEHVTLSLCETKYLAMTIICFVVREDEKLTAFSNLKRRFGFAGHRFRATKPVDLP
jgi:hypothetical protein